MAGARRYMSKSQRPCDFCRSRRTACRIEDTPPCRQCRLHARACTFNEASAPRKPRCQEQSRVTPPNGVSAQGILQPPGDDYDEHLMLDGVSHGHPDDPLVVSENFRPDESLFLHESWAHPDLMAAEFEAVDIHPEAVHLDYPSAGPGSDQNDLGSIADRLTFSLEDNPVSQPLGDVLVSHFIGPTGEHDPNLIRRYRFNANHELWFKKLAFRATSHGANPTQWLLTMPDKPNDPDAFSPDTRSIPDDRAALENLVPNDIGDRLIKL
jgi:hypothetical protein